MDPDLLEDSLEDHIDPVLMEDSMEDHMDPVLLGDSLEDQMDLVLLGFLMSGGPWLICSDMAKIVLRLLCLS